MTLIEVSVVKDYQAMSDLAAEIIANTIKANPSCTLGLATGSSPIGTYQNLLSYVLPLFYFMLTGNTPFASISPVKYFASALKLKTLAS